MNKKNISIFIFFQSIIYTIVLKKIIKNEVISHQLPVFMYYFISGMFSFIYWDKINENLIF